MRFARTIYLKTIKIMQTDQIIIYQTTEEQTAIDVKPENETIWLAQAHITQLSRKFSIKINCENVTYKLPLSCTK